MYYFLLLPSQEQDIIRFSFFSDVVHLINCYIIIIINEAASSLSMAVKTGDLQTAKVAQIMLDSVNDKLNEATKQLVNIRACKEKLQAKLMKA